MKVIYTEQLKKIAFQNKEVEKAEGIYKDIRDAFPEDTQHTQQMVEGLQEEEMEKQMLQEALSNGPSSTEALGLDPEDFSETFLRISNAMSYGKDLKIGYFTYESGVYIERSIRPEYIYRAESTNNNVLVTWCYDWDEYRAFILDNIVFAESNEQNSIGEEQI